MSGSLLQTFTSLEKNTKEALADLASPRQLSLAALLVAEDRCGVSTLTAEHITACLEAAGIAVRRLSVARALANARGAIAAAKNQDGETEYKLMIREEGKSSRFWVEAESQLSELKAISHDQPDLNSRKYCPSSLGLLGSAIHTMESGLLIHSILSHDHATSDS